jgi:hypothetical protein
LCSRARSGEIGGDDVDDNVRVTLEQRLAQLLELVSATCNQDEVHPALGKLDGELLADSPLEPVINAVLLLRSTWCSYGSRRDQASR